MKRGEIKSISASGYCKRLLDVVTTDFSSAILEAAGLKTVGREPSVVDRAEQQEKNSIRDQQ